ncbi:MAG TPA: hypothetical protein PK969_02125 [Treponemataceae bacterium]|nr:hypothetical protein [Treponemataceae bacterium]
MQMMQLFRIQEVLRRARRVLVVGLRLLCGPAFISGQTGYLPPNPVAPPEIQKIAPPTVTPPAAPTAPTTSAAPAAPSPGSTQGASSGSSVSQRSASQRSAQAKPAASDDSVLTVNAAALSLLGLDSDNALLSALAGTGSGDLSTSDSAILKKILELLENQAVQANSAGRESQGAAAAPAAKAVQSEGAELVRFSVNGYSILGTVTALVSSVQAVDGSFLITGDRSFTASGNVLSETFYLLCRPAPEGRWLLTAEVTQNPENPNSFLFHLADRSPVYGEQTGNLIVFRSAADKWLLDLVIRLADATVR